MKKLLSVVAVTVLALSLGACKENQGVAKGNFEKECVGLNGAMARVSANEYTCTLPDGVVLKSANK